jgi:hypothetical protein
VIKLVEKEEPSSTRIFAFTVTAKAKAVVSKDVRRKCFYIYNNGSESVYLLSAQNQKYTDGIPIAASGDYENDSSTAAFWLISASGSVDVRVEVDGE